MKLLLNLLAVAILMLSSCTAVEQVNDLQNRAEVISKKIDRKIGTKSDVGFQINNDQILCQVYFESLPDTLSANELLKSVKREVANTPGGANYQVMVLLGDLPDEQF